MRLRFLPTIFIFFLFFGLAVSTFAADIVITPFSEQEDLASFLEGVLAHLQSIIGYLAVLFVILGGVLYAMSAGNPNLAKAAKVCWSAALIGFALAAAGPSFLREIKLRLFGGNVPANPEEIPSIKMIVMNVMAFLLSVVGFLGIIGLVLSGIFYVFAIGNKSQVDSAKSAMKYSIIGIAIAGLSLALITEIRELIIN
jgi:hypothetical protein